MLRMIVPAALAAALVTASVQGHGGQPAPDAALWPALAGTAEDILERRRDAWANPEAARNGWSLWDFGTPFGDGRDHRLDRLLDHAVEALSRGGAAELRARIAELRRQRAEAERRAADLRAGLAGLPDDSCDAAGPTASWAARQVACVFATSREDQARRIADARAAIGRIDAEIARLADGLGEELAALGVRLTPEQVDGLLRLATADGIIAAHTVYDNLRRVNAELQRATVAADESVETARRYYGFHAVLLEVALHLHDRFLDDVRARHLPRLDVIEAEARAARGEARRLIGRDSDDPLAAQLRANVAALDLTLEAASLYRRTLAEQTAAVEAARRRVERQRDVAVNTWRTVRASAEMLDLMNASGQGFETLLDLDLPPPRAFENAQLQKEFERLTLRLTAAGE